MPLSSTIRDQSDEATMSLQPSNFELEGRIRMIQLSEIWLELFSVVLRPPLVRDRRDEGRG